MDSFTDFELDSLKEVVSIGVGNASGVLSSTLKESILLSVPQLEITSPEKVPSVFNSLGGDFKIVTLDINGDIKGNLLIIYKTDAGDLKQFLKIFDDYSLVHLSGILAKSSLDAIANFLKLSIYPSNPKILKENVEDSLKGVIDGCRVGEADALLIYLTFSSKTKIGGSFYFLFDPQSTKKIIDSTKEKLS